MHAYARGEFCPALPEHVNRSLDWAWETAIRELGAFQTEALWGGQAFWRQRCTLLRDKVVDLYQDPALRKIAGLNKRHIWTGQGCASKAWVANYRQVEAADVLIATFVLVCSAVGY